MMHIFKYRFLCFTKNKVLMFWTLVFPMCLATLFHFAFGNLDTAGNLESIDVAIVSNENEGFNSLVEELAKGENKIINPVYVEMDEANELLEDGEVSAILISEAVPSIIFNTESMQIQIIKEVVQSFVTKDATLTSLMSSGEISETIVSKVFENNVEIIEKDSKAIDANLSSQYFFTVVAMMVLYSGYWGVKIMEDVQANQSPQALRLNVTPTHKLKVMLIDFIIALIVMCVEVSILLFYLMNILKVDFGSNMILMSLVVLTGIIASLAMGILLGAFSKFKSIININIYNAVSLFSCFLAGMMMSELPYIIDQSVPIVKYVNPASLITNSFNIIYFYEDVSTVYTNVIILSILGFVFLGISYTVLRRKSYASV